MKMIQKLPPMKMSDDVISAINEELAYQSNLQATGKADAKDHGVAGQLVTLQVYTQEALTAWAKNAGDKKSLDALRKVAAIAVRALESHGCPKRA